MIFRSQRRTQGFYQSRYERNRTRKRARATVRWVVILFVLYIFITGWIVTPLKVRTEALEPAARPGALAFAAPGAYGVRIPFSDRMLRYANPGVGDLAVVRPPGAPVPGPVLRAVDAPVRFLSFSRIRLADGFRRPWALSRTVKRVVAGPGSRVFFSGDRVYIRTAGAGGVLRDIRGRRVPYEARELRDRGFSEVSLREGQWFCLSENPGAGTDSRHYGPLETEAFRARVFGIVGSGSDS